MRFYLFGQKSGNMSLRQRGAGLIAALESLANIPIAVALGLLPIVMLTGHPLIVSTDHHNLRVLLFLAIASVISEWLDNCAVALITGHKTAISESYASYWMVPCKSIFIRDVYSQRQLTIFRSRSSYHRRFSATMDSAQGLSILRFWSVISLQ